MWKRWRTSTRLILYSISGNGVRRQELGDATIIREAFRMEQVNAPAQAYHQQMKRELPVTCCTECGGAGYNIRNANGRCCKTSGEQRCSGINAIAIKAFDWSECTQCEATGYYRNKVCPNCKGAGYLFVGLRDKATA
jgi:DnaJ-class molecular chaperone